MVSQLFERMETVNTIEVTRRACMQAIEQLNRNSP